MKEGFSHILGNSDTKAHLISSISLGTLPHALLITGPSGSGKRTLAKEITAATNCLLGTEGAPCGECSRCKRIFSDSFPDFRLLGRSSGKASIGVEELRTFREDMFLSPTESPFKFYVIEDADLMTPAAQNAILKVLEEPPSAVHIILLASEGDKILSTIKSRTQAISMQIFGFDELMENVCRLSDKARSLLSSDKDKLKAILLSSGGVIGDALAMLDDGRIAEIEADRKIILSFVESFSKKTPFSKLYTSVTAFPQKREELRRMLEETRCAVRDMVSAKVSDDITPIFFLNADDARRSSEGIGKKKLIAIFDIITAAIADLDKNVLIPPLLTDIAVKIREV